MEPDYEKAAAAHRAQAESLDARAKQMDELAKRHIKSADPNEQQLAPARQKEAQRARKKAADFRNLAAVAEGKAKQQKAETREKAGEAKDARRKADAAKADEEKKASLAKEEAKKEAAGQKTEAEKEAAKVKSAEEKTAAPSSTATDSSAQAQDVDFSKVYGSVDSVDTAVAVTGGEAYQVGRVSKDNAFILEVDGQKYLYANPEYSGYRKLVQQASPHDGKVENAEHVASKTLESRRGQGFVLMGKVDAKVNQAHGRTLETEYNTKGERSTIQREFNHYAAIPVKETGGIAHRVRPHEMQKLANKGPDEASIYGPDGKISDDDKKTISSNLLQDKPAQDNLEAMKSKRIVTKVDNAKSRTPEAAEAAERAEQARKAAEARAKEQERQNAQHKPGRSFKM